MIYLDTHVVAWLYAGETERLSERAVDLIEAEELLVSPIVQLELEYLKETGKLKVGSALILESLEHSVGLSLCDHSFAQVVIESVRQSWTRDPFDRIITAHALSRESLLITKDSLILKNYGFAVW